MFKKIWKALSGKKTNIGAATLLAAIIASQLGIEESQAISILQWLGEGVAVIGLLHKAIKKVVAKE